MKKVEVLAGVIAVMMFCYFLGYYDGASTRRHTRMAQVLP